MAIFKYDAILFTLYIILFSTISQFCLTGSCSTTILNDIFGEIYLYIATHLNKEPTPTPI